MRAQGRPWHFDLKIGRLQYQQLSERPPPLALLLPRLCLELLRFAEGLDHDRSRVERAIKHHRVILAALAPEVERLDVALLRSRLRTRLNKIE